MVKRRIKLEDLQFVDEEEVPKPAVKTQWEEIFKRVPSGKALVLDQFAPSTVRTALKRCQEKGQFRNLYTTTRKKEKGKYLSYVVNPRVTESE